MEAAVRATTSSGYVPATVLATIQQPMLWANGADDRQVPPTVNAEILRSLHHSNWDIEILPGVDHGLFENPSGLEPDEPKATKLASGFRDLIAAWLARTVGVSP
jgi:pimeloyl-ACP methyl ester carboxylesterase